MKRITRSRRFNPLIILLITGLSSLFLINDMNAQILTPVGTQTDACDYSSRFFVSGSQPARSAQANFIRLATFNVNTSGVGDRTLNSFNIELIGDFDSNDLENSTGGALFYIQGNFSANAATDIRALADETKVITGPGTYSFTPGNDDGGRFTVLLELSPEASKSHFWLRQPMNSSNFSFSPSTTLSGEVPFRTGTTEPRPSLPENLQFTGGPGFIQATWDTSENESHTFQLFDLNGNNAGSFTQDPVSSSNFYITPVPEGRYSISLTTTNEIGGGCILQSRFAQLDTQVPSCFSKPAKPNITSANPTPAGGVSIQTTGIPIDPSNSNLYERNPSNNEAYRRVSIARVFGSPRVFPIDGSLPETLGDDHNRVTSSATVNGAVNLGTTANPRLPNTTYEIDIYTLHLGPTVPGADRCIIYSSQFSRTLITTCEAGPSEIATNLSESNILENSAQLSWDNGDGAQRIVVVKPGLGQQFESINTSSMSGIDYNANNDFSNAPLIPQVPIIHNSFQILDNIGGRVVYEGSGNSVTVTGLTTATGYTWHVLEFNDTGECVQYNTTRVLGNEGRFTTISNDLSVTTQSVTNRTSSSAIVGGNVELINNVSVTQRGVVWSTGNNPVLSDNQVVAGAGSGSFTTSIQGLNPERRHYVRAYGIANGQVFYGNNRQFYTTSNEPSGDPTNLVLDNLQPISETQLSATFDWDGASGASGYLLLYRRDGNLPTVVGIEDGVHPEDLDLASGTFLASDQLIEGTGFVQNNGIFPDLTYNYLLIPVSADQDNNPQTYNYKTSGLLPTISFATDLDPPSITGFQPQNGAVDVPLGSVVSLQMNEVVTKGSGDILIVDASSQNTIRTISIASADVSVNGQVVTIDPSGLPVSTEMYPTIPEGAFIDAQGNELAAFTGKGNVWQFTTADQGDVTPPVITRFTPEDGTSNVNVQGIIRLDFNEPITIGSGNITIRRTSNNSDVQVIPIDDPAVEAFQSYVNISPNNLPGETDLYVLLDNGAITDASGNDFGGINNSTTWTFTTDVSPDVTPPTISTLVPADNATNVALNAPLIVRFNEPVTKGSGFVSIKFASDGTTRETINVNGTSVTISGNQASIVPSNALPGNTQLFVEISNGAFQDSNGNNFEGISNPTLWSFTTTTPPDGNQPQLLVNSVSPVNGAFDIAFDTNLQFSFNEDVLKGTGDILIRNQFTDAVAATIDVTSGQVSISNNVVTLNPASNLSEGSFTVEIPGTAFKDATDNFYPGLLDESWAFTTVSAPPSLVSFTPIDGAGNVALDGTLTLNFNEDVEPGTSGLLQIRNRSTNGLIASFQPEISAVNYNGQQVTIDLNLSNSFFGIEVFVSISDAFVQDLNGNPFSDGFNDTDTWNFTLEDQVDVTAPTLVTNSFTPLDNALNVAVDTDLVFSFNEPVTLNGGRINIKDSNTDNLIETVFLTTNVNINGSQVTVERTSDLGEGRFYIEIEDGTFSDASGNEFSGLFDKNIWNFITTGTPPAIDELIPVIGATNVGVTGTASATFDEPITLGNNGNIVIARVDNGSPLQTIPRTDPSVSINGSTLSIDYDVTGFEGTELFIRVQAGAIEDLNGNDLIALNGNTWNFTTAAAPDVAAPVLFGGPGGLDPINNSTLVPTDANLGITFNEEIQKGTGVISIHRFSDDVLLQGIPVSDPAVTISGSEVTIDPDDFPDVSIYVLVSGDAFQDNSGNFYAGINDKNTWRLNPVVTQPRLLSMSPEAGTADVAAGEPVTFSLFFSEDIQLGSSGTMVVRRIAGNVIAQTIELTDPSLEITGNQLSFEVNIPENEIFSLQDMVIVPNVAFIEDLNGNTLIFSGPPLSEITGFTAELIDTTSPAILTSSFSPTHTSVNVPYNSNLSFEFNEEVIKNSGNILIRDLNNSGAIIQTIDVNSTEVSVSGTTVTIDPIEDLPEARIYIEVENGAFTDLSGNIRAQMPTWQTTWNFFTFQVPLTAVSFSPPNGSTNIQINEPVVFEATFSHDIAPNTLPSAGDILIRSVGGGILQTIPHDDPAVTLDGNKLSFEFTLTGNLFGLTLSAQLQSGVVQDLNGISKSTQVNGTWNFTVEEATPPEIISRSPMDDAVGVPLDANIVATFSEDVTKNSSFLARLWTLDPGSVIVEEFDDQHPGVTLSGNQLTINPTDDLEQGRTYWITLNSNSVVDVEGSGNANLSGNVAWNFTSFQDDFAAPVITNRSPADDAVNVAVDANLELEFDEPVFLPIIGNITEQIRIHNENGTVFEQFTLPSARVTGYGTNTITIDPTNDFEDDAEYYVIWFSPFEDEAGNITPDISTDTEWNFSTGNPDLTPPSVQSFSPADETIGVPLNQRDFVITFDEPVQSTGLNGFARIRIKPGGTQVGVFTMTDPDQVIFSGNTLTLHLESNASFAAFGNTDMYITLPNGVIEDLSGNVFTGWTDDETWDFTTEEEDVTAPVITSRTPDDEATNVAVDANITITFDEIVNLPPSGTRRIRIRQSSNSLLFEDFLLPSPRVTGYGTNTITIDPTDDLLDNRSYYVQYFDAFEDESGNNVPQNTSSTNWNFHTGVPDITAPVVQGFSPDDDAENVPVDANLVITFDDDVQSTFINLFARVRRKSNGGQIAAIPLVNASQAIFSGNTLTLDPLGDLPLNTELYVEIPASGIENAEGIEFPGFTDSDTWNFTTVVSNLPTLISVAPNGGIETSVSVNLFLGFSEEVQKGSGNILIKDAADNSVIQTIDVSSSEVTINPMDMEVVINPNTDLPFATEVYLEMPSGVFEDLDSNPFAGIADPATFTFVTEFNAESRPEVVSLSPTNGSSDVAINTTLTATFQEPISVNMGNIEIREVSGDALVESFDVSDAAIGVMDEQLTITPTMPLPHSTEVYVTICNTCISDEDDVEFAGFLTTNDWRFTTAGPIDNTSPVVDILVPADDAVDVAIDANLTITFSEDIFPVMGGNGLIRLVDFDTDNVVEDFDPEENGNGGVTISGNVLTLNPTNDLQNDQQYYVIFNNFNDDFLEDAAGNPVAGYNDNVTWNFTTEAVADVTAPTVDLFSPMHQSTDVAVDIGQLQITFSEPIQKTNPGNIIVRDFANNIFAQYFPAFSDNDVVVSGNTLTMNLPSDLEFNTSYYVQFISGTIADLAGNNFPGFNNASTWIFTTEGPADTTPPNIVSVSPTNNSTDVAVDTDLVIEFSEPVVLGNSSFLVKFYDNNVNKFNINYASSDVVLNDNTVTITLPGNLDAAMQFWVQINPGTITDAAGNAFAGIVLANRDDWNFTTVASPELVSFTPVDNATDVNPATDLVLNFDEPVVKGSGSIRLIEVGTDDELATIDVNSINVNISDNVVTISQAIPDRNTEVRVNIDAGAFEDLIGLPYAGLNSNTAWTFSILSNDQTAPTISSLTPANDATDVPINTNLEIEFSEPVVLGSGSFFVKFYSSNANRFIINFNSDDVILSGNTVTVSLPSDLAFDTRYWIGINPGTITDMAGNDFAGIVTANKDDWNFTTFPELTHVSLFPADNSIDADPTLPMEIEFPRNVNKGSGSIRIIDTDGFVEINTIDVNSSDVTISNNIVSIVNAIPDDNVSLRILIDAGAFTDEFGGAYDGLTAGLWDFTVQSTDTTAPFIVSMTPMDNATEVSIDTDLVIEFNEDVILGNGNFRIYFYNNNSVTQTIGFDDPEVTHNGNMITIDLPNDLLIDTHYWVGISLNRIEDAVGNTFPGINITNRDEWGFFTDAAPEIIQLSPADGADNVAVNSNLVIEFDQIVNVNAGGNILIRNFDLPGQAPFETIDVTSGQVTGSGTNTITIDPSITLDRDFHYYIQIEDDAFSDQTGNFFEGILGFTTWEFVTEPKLDQAITFNALTNRTFGEGNFDLTASSNSGLTIDYVSSNTSVATVLGNTVTIVGAGTTTITASQAGDGNYNPAIDVNQDLIVEKANQTITIDPVANKLTTDGSFSITASTTSSLTLDYDITSGPATNTGATVTLTGQSGTVTVAVSQAGNENYNAASESITFNVLDPAKTDQTITFEAISDKMFGETFTLEASSDSGLDIEYSIVDGPISLSGSQVTINGVGNATIAANQAGDDNFNPADEVRQTFTINKANQVITIVPIADKLTTDAPFMASASVGSGLPLTFEVSGPATISGQEISLTGEAGTVTLTVSQVGNENYNAASAQISFEVEQPVTPNNVPSGINLTNSTIEENLEAGSLVGELSSPDLDSEDQHIYSLVPGEGDDDNDSFSLTGNQLLSAEVFDFETKSSYNIRIKSDDQNGGAFEKSFTITIEDVEENVVTAIDEDLNPLVSVYPNPATEVVNITNLRVANNSVFLELLTLAGVTLKRVEVHSSEYSFDLTSVKDGLYLIRIIADDSSTTKRLLVR